MDSNSPLATLLNRNMRSHEIKENGDFISLSPLQSDDATGSMEAFQEFAEFVLKYDGHGYKVVKTHTASGHGVRDLDLILVERTDR